jgi:alkanesulfonate monooxygenase SsuD/methylene tetrahydromethanopterin reductase-like flavin-dependent oxidoreductase (luciferase family)
MGEGSGLQVGMSSPWGLFGLPPAEQRGRLGELVEAGIDHVFIADHVSFRGGTGIDGLVHLAVLAGLEPRLRLELGVFLLALRHPMVAARQIATLAEAAPGRLTVGVGVGGEDRHEFEVCGVDPRTRGRRTDAALRIVRALLAGETVDNDDEFFHLDAARIVPVPDPAVPLVVGGRSDAALVRAGTLGDGWLAAWCSARRFAEGVQRVEEVADAAGRPGAAGRHGLQLWVGVGADPVEARRHVAEGMERFYRIPFEPFERYTPVGTAEDIAGFLEPYVVAGCRVLNLTPVGPDRETELATLGEVRRLLRA